MGSDASQVFPALRKRLTDLESHVEEHDVARADPSDIPEFEAMFFSLARDVLAEAFELPQGFTYEEAGSVIEASERSAPLRAQGTKVTNLLNRLEYAPDRSYREIDEHLIELGQLLDLAVDEPRIKRVEETGKERGKLTGMLIKATSIFWFPFRWAYLALSRKHRERKVDRHETYEIEALLEKASSELEKERLEDAISTYKRVAEAYASMPQALKAQVHDRIIALHGRIMQSYEALSKKKTSGS
ncbi:MAG: hypothetical protein ACMXYM_02080 [Candidatus Woesearchaeota archaeon]